MNFIYLTFTLSQYKLAHPTYTDTYTDSKTIN